MQIKIPSNEEEAMMGCPAGLREKRGGLLPTGLHQSPQLKALHFNLTAGKGEWLKNLQENKQNFV